MFCPRFDDQDRINIMRNRIPQVLTPDNDENLNNALRDSKTAEATHLFLSPKFKNINVYKIEANTIDR